ncbi:MAG: 16S rRNA (cytidine(1402)-2'-O)-methyltransferase [Ndongobacter sp.]|nr:16S rRNA (cytidine(1402)-2'-O)-methyltransferase [Ndongobacter sp.]
MEWKKASPQGAGGMLYLVPTPIGNLEDITLRALRVLREADAIACEDTRHTRILLKHYEIHKPLVSFHQHNERAMAERLIDRVCHGEVICVVSDAGMPGISDPGRAAVLEARRRGAPYTVLPGASAVLTAVVAAGMGDGRFVFRGFLPRRGSERTAALEGIDRAAELSVFYEAPHRIRETLKELSARWPDRFFATARELTKQFEELHWFRGAELVLDEVEERGEYVILIDAAPFEPVSKQEVLAQIDELAQRGLSSKEMIRQVCECTGWKKNEVYRLVLERTNP